MPSSGVGRLETAAGSAMEGAESESAGIVGAVLAGVLASSAALAKERVRMTRTLIMPIV